MGELEMARAIVSCLLAILLFQASEAIAAAEKGLVIRAGDLMAQPFIDAAKSGPLTANQQVTIIERRGAWANVESNGKTGWVRTLNLRLEPRPGTPGAARPSGSSVSLNPLTALQTGSSGRTVTTGVKGMSEEDIRNATPDFEQVGLLDQLGVDAADARANAQKANLKENTVNYLDKGGHHK
jgi:hypothetical protein